MVRLSGNTIYCTQGDTLDLQINITDQDGEPYIPEQNDLIRFAMKGNYRDAEPLIVKIIPNDTLRLRLESDETKRLKPRDVPYVYDVEITMDDGTVDTFIERQKLYITEEVY